MASSFTASAKFKSNGNSLVSRTLEWALAARCSLLANRMGRDHSAAAVYTHVTKASSGIEKMRAFTPEIPAPACLRLAHFRTTVPVQAVD
jgi:hypothetical protein